MTSSISRKSKKVIGLLGGSFNPAHTGHLYISLYAIENLNLDEVWWIVTKQNPLKEKDIYDSFETRINACKKITENYKKINISDTERLMDSTYAIDVIHKIKSENPEVIFIWLMGNDNLENFHKWYKWEKFVNEIPIAIFNRTGHIEHSLSKTRFYEELKDRITSNKQEFINSVFDHQNKILLLKNEKYKVSSTKIRGFN
jgi:nicotinate-nucleotide adenylyltransferase